MGAHAGRRGRGLGPGGPGRVTRARGLSRRLGARWLPRGRASELCPFHRRLRACAGAHRWLLAGGSKAGGGNTAARHTVLRPDASRVFSGQWPYAYRRCRRCLPGSPHKREGDRRQGRAPHRSAYRVSLFGAAPQWVIATTYERMTSLHLAHFICLRPKDRFLGSTIGSPAQEFVSSDDGLFDTGIFSNRVSLDPPATRSHRTDICPGDKGIISGDTLSLPILPATRN